MSERKVVPFRKRPPCDAELQVYRQMTRNWHPELKRLMLPEHFECEERSRKS